MTTYYVDGTNGNDAYDGTSAAFVSGSVGPKKTLTAMEAKPVAAGDLVHVRPGTYRETLTCGVSGTVGNAIEYRGDYAGVIWAGGGVVRITGSNDDKTATRINCIAATSRNYRTFSQFVLGETTIDSVALTDCAGIVFQRVVFMPANSTGRGLNSLGASQSALTVQSCFFMTADNAASIDFGHSATVNDTGHVVQNCIFWGDSLVGCVRTSRVGGITVKNCFLRGRRGVQVAVALAAGQSVTVNNCLIEASTALQATAVGEIVEDYNNISSQTSTARTNVNVGAHSTAYFTLLDPRWAFQLMTAAAANQVVTLFDLASYSQLINLAGTSPTTTDLRGTSAIGGTREWGALEYDSTLKIQGGSGGAVSISPLRGRLGG